MTQPNLWGSFLKLDRAMELLDALQDEVTSTIGFASPANPVKTGMDFNPEMTEYRLWLRHIPTDLIGRYGVLIGDIAHNLRSALDHLAWELVRIGSDRQPRMPRMVQFPCCDTPGEFRAELGKRLPGVGAEYIAAIEDLQPYKRGKLPQFIQRGAP